MTRKQQLADRFQSILSCQARECAFLCVKGFPMKRKRPSRRFMKRKRPSRRFVKRKRPSRRFVPPFRSRRFRLDKSSFFSYSEEGDFPESPGLSSKTEGFVLKPITKDDILSALRSAGLQKGHTVIVHTSLWNGSGKTGAEFL